VGQACSFRQIVVIQLERWRDGRIQHFNVVCQHFDLAGFQIRVTGSLRAAAYNTGDTQTEFITHRFCGSKNICTIRIADHLHQTFAVAQINKNHTAVITTTMNPAAQADGLAE
jgi:hypothetical protein